MDAMDSSLNDRDRLGFDAPEMSPLVLGPRRDAYNGSVEDVEYVKAMVPVTHR